MKQVDIAMKLNNLCILQNDTSLCELSDEIMRSVSATLSSSDTSDEDALNDQSRAFLKAMVDGYAIGSNTSADNN